MNTNVLLYIYGRKTVRRIKKRRMFMYDNIGKKIQTIAKITGWSVIIICALVWFVLIVNGESEKFFDIVNDSIQVRSRYNFDTTDDWIAWVTLLSGAIYYVTSWFIYVFGQLVDDVHAMREKDSAPATPAGSSTNFYNNRPEL